MNIFLGNVWAGIVAGLLVLFGQYLLRKLKLRRNFAGLAGVYNIQQMPSGVATNTTVTIKYRGQNILETEGRDAAGKVEWRGWIYMHESVPYSGEGVYQYTKPPDCGIHQIQRNASDGSIYAWGKNTSHGREYVFARLWLRR